jgi:hypothetical protein
MASPAFNPFSAVAPLPTQGSSLVPLDANGNPIGPYGGVYGAPQAAPAYLSQTGASQAAQTQNNNNYINEAGQQINQEAQGNLAYEGALQAGYTGNENQALNQLAQTPGYTPGEASQINANYSQFNTPQSALQSEFLTPTEQSAIAGNPNQPVGVATSGTNAEGALLNQTQQEYGGTLGQYDTQLGGATGAFQQQATGAASGLQNNLNTAVGGLGSGLQSAQSGFSSLNSAVNNPALAFDPNGTEKQITDAQVQQMATNAGQAVGAQYQTAEDQLQRQAAAAGNTSPLAIAAANARLQAQEASGEGNAESNAQIAALQAQQTQASSIEQQREGAAFQQTGLQAGAATTEQAQAQNAAALAGTQNIGAQETAGQANIAAEEAAGQAGINSANATNQAALSAVQNYGALAQNEASTAEQQNYGAASTAENEAAARAATLGTNRQAAQTNVNNTQYSQGTGSQQLTAAGAQATGNARIAGQNTYLNTVAGAGQQAQTGGQNAVSNQQNAFSTQASNLTAGTTALGQYRTQPSTTAAGEIKETNPVVVAKGGIFTKPTLAIVGESGPEFITRVPGGRYKRKAA